MAVSPSARPRGAAVPVRLAGSAGRALLVGWYLLPLVPVLLWTVADRWSYPARLPQRWGDSGWVTAIRSGALASFGRSTVLGLAVAALAVPAGALAARALTLGRPWSPRTAGAILLAPVAVPPFAIVMGLNVVLLRLNVPSMLGVVLVLAVSALPYTTYAMRVAYGSYDVGYEEQARTLGAAPATVTRVVSLPILAPALAGAAFLAFLVGWSDYLVTVLIGGGQLVTYPVLLASAASGTGNEAVVAAMTVAALVPPVALLLVLRQIGRAGRGRRG
jgi:putative spermidine/putrescine transport system permease protein